jgi:asparagine synthase (glutamine-hydrolysing)
VCGIAGWVGDVGGDRRTLRRMCDALAHRGPDDFGELIVPGRAAIGFRRLAVIDLKTGNQPIADEGSNVHVTCNGEIYNFRRLRNELEGRGHRFRSGSDSEVIAHLYEERGVDCLGALQGMFAIALWDEAAECLLLARDRLGVKPVYWAPAGDGILYASEPGAILASRLVEPRPDPRALLDYMTLQYVPPPRTGFDGIRKLAPGERLVHEGGRARIERYWELDFSKVGSHCQEESLERLDSLLAEATRDRLVADVPLGAFLSGGIDSSLVVSYMAEAGGQVKTFSIDFPEAGFSESEHARRVAQIYGTEHEDRRLEPAIVPLVADVVHHAGEPFADSSAIPTLMLSRMARERVTVALSGDGGDEAFAGYRRYLEVDGRRPLAQRAARLLVNSGALSVLPNSAQGLREGASTRAMPETERYAWMMSHFSPADLSAICAPAFIEAAGGPGPAWEETLSPPDLPGVDRYLALDTATYLPGDLLLKVDRMSMATALEVRSPLLDHRVHEFAAGLPASMKLRGRETKWALKELARRRGLPDDLVRRPKQGFGVPIGAWLRGELRPWVEEVLLDPRTLARGYFEPERVRSVLVEHLDGHADHTYKVWNLAVLELWHRSWIDAG